MAATTTPLIDLLKQLKTDFPTVSFVEGERFLWSPVDHTVYYELDGAPELLLHELGHALLKHAAYTKDVQLLGMERAAWEVALEKAKDYMPAANSEALKDTMETHLDSYRDWLHARSTCPACTATGFQSGAQEYTCPACLQVWTVNEARGCQLRRHRK